jgi:type III secretion protein J
VRPSSLAIVVTFAAMGCSVELEHGLDERQANQVASVLGGAGIPAEKAAESGQNDRFLISVPRGDVARAFQVLEERDLPRRGQKGLAEMFGDSSFLPSAVEERTRLGAAIATELERTLEGIPGVTSARVHLALPPEESVIGEMARQRPTASVLVKTRGSLPISESDVRRLVAGGVHTLQTADVAVLVTTQPSEAKAQILDQLGPLRIAHESRSTAATLAASLLLLILLLGVAVAVIALRLNALKRRLRQLEKHP